MMTPGAMRDAIAQWQTALKKMPDNPAKRDAMAELDHHWLWWTEAKIARDGYQGKLGTGYRGKRGSSARSTC